MVRKVGLEVRRSWARLLFGVCSLIWLSFEGPWRLSLDCPCQLHCGLTCGSHGLAGHGNDTPRKLPRLPLAGVVGLFRVLLWSFFGVTFPVHFGVSGQESENIPHNIPLHNQRKTGTQFQRECVVNTAIFSFISYIQWKPVNYFIYLFFFRSKQIFVTVVWNQWNCKGSGGRHARWYPNKWGKQIINECRLCWIWRLSWDAEQVVQEKN